MKYISDPGKTGATFTLTRSEKAWIVVAVTNAILEAFIGSMHSRPSDMCFLVDVDERLVNFGAADGLLNSALTKDDHPELAAHLRNRSNLPADDALAIVKKGSGVMMLTTLHEIADICSKGLLS